MNTFLKFKYSTESIGCGEEDFILKFNEDIIADNAEDCPRYPRIDPLALLEN